MAHFRDEDSHAGLHVVEIEVEGDAIALRVERGDIFVNLVARNEEVVKFPFDAHEEHRVNRIHILVEIDDVSLVVCDKLCYL